MNHQPLIYGFDTVEIAYYLKSSRWDSLDFERLVAHRDSLKLSGLRHSSEIQLGSETFGLAPHGTSSGYPILLTNESFTVQCGENNNPSFFVTYSSLALWHDGLEDLHRRFLLWAESVGLEQTNAETISRMDYAVDFHLLEIDFQADDFISQAQVDVQHRKNRKVQTFRVGQDAVVLRVYNKSDEVKEQSSKFWFYPLWGYEDDVWRIEFQIRKEVLREFGIYTVADLMQQYGTLLSKIADEHTRLAVPSSDSNRSRWGTHPLWRSLQDHYATLPQGFEGNEFNRDAHLDARLERCCISLMGYLKRMSAIKALQNDSEPLSLGNTLMDITKDLYRLHDPLTWSIDVEHRMKQMRLGL